MPRGGSGSKRKAGSGPSPANKRNTRSSGSEQDEANKEQNEKEEQQATASDVDSDGDGATGNGEEIPLDIPPGQPMRDVVKQYARRPFAARKAAYRKLIDYEFKCPVIDDMSCHHLAVVIKDLQGFLKNACDNCDIATREKERLKEELEKTKAKLHHTERELSQKKSFVHLGSFKIAADKAVKGVTYMQLFRKFIFLHNQTTTTEDILKDAGFVPKKNKFVQGILDAIFRELEKPLRKQKDIDNAGAAGPNVYTNGQKHVFNTDEQREKLWSDETFASKFVVKFNHKRNSQSSGYRKLLGKTSGTVSIG